MDITASLRASYMDLNERIALFCEQLQQAELIRATVYIYPEYDTDAIGKIPDMIPLAPVEGAKAFQLTLEHIRRHKIPQSRQGRLVSRLPGSVVLQADDPTELYQRALDINNRKDEFSALILSISEDKNVRFETVSKACPDLIKKLATRHLVIAGKPLKSLGFTWSHRHSSKRMTKRHVIAMLTKTADYYDKRPLEPLMAEMVSDEIKCIHGYPGSTQFRIHRPLRVAPMMNVLYHDAPPFIDGMPAPKTIIAHSPMLLINQSPRIHAFKSYVAAHEEAPSMSTTRKLVIPRLYLYAEN